VAFFVSIVFVLFMLLVNRAALLTFIPRLDEDIKANLQGLGSVDCAPHRMRNNWQADFLSMVPEKMAVPEALVAFRCTDCRAAETFKL
jgi:hypothetical protein